MAASASGQPANVVLWDMPLAQALQFAAAWLEIQGNKTYPTNTGTIESAIFNRIANR